MIDLKYLSIEPGDFIRSTSGEVFLVKGAFGFIGGTPTRWQVIPLSGHSVQKTVQIDLYDMKYGYTKLSNEEQAVCKVLYGEK